MSDDIVERLRRKVFVGPTVQASHTKTVEWQAADEIERLRAENEQQAERIKYLERHVDVLQDKLPDDACACGYDEPGDMCATHWAERAALAEQEKEG